MSDVYERLRKRLDDLAVGFPETESKIEIRLLKQLFTEAEAEFFVLLHPVLESPDAAAKRLKRDPDEVADSWSEWQKRDCFSGSGKTIGFGMRPCPGWSGYLSFR